MGWQDDLLKLLQENDADPLSDIARSLPGQAVGAVAGPVLGSGLVQGAFNAMDLPRQGAFGAAGQLHALSEGRGPIDWSQAQAEEGARISNVQKQEWGPFGILKTPVEVGANLALDPTTYLGFGAGTKIARGAETAAVLAREAGHPILSGGLRTAAAGARGSQFLWNDAGQAVLEGGRIPAAITRGGQDVIRFPASLAGRDVGIQPAFRKVAGGINRLPGSPLSLTPEMAGRKEDDAIAHATSALESTQGVTYNQTQPVSSIFDTAAPPQAPHPHPPGSAPDQAYRTGVFGWLKLQHPKLGIVPGMKGEDYWRSPDQVKLTDDHLWAMADIGVAAMQRVTDEGGLFPSIMRATRGTQQMREGIIKQFGPGIEPFIPQVQSRMREALALEGLDPDVMMPASRHFLPHGWSKSVMNTRRLESIQKKVDLGKLTREQGLAEVARYPKNIQAVDAAAAHGASLLSLFRQGEKGAYKEFLPGGVYFPQGLEGSRPNSRVMIPKNYTRDVWEGTGPLGMDARGSHELLGVAQPFGTNRAAWNAYMRKQLPGIKDDELQTLAGMSQDMLYHAYVNAAHPLSGGERGAERIFRATINGELDRKRMETRGGTLADTTRKASPEKGGQIGGLLPNLTDLMGHYAEGLDIRSGAGHAKDYFPNAVKEVVRIVGAGNYEDAQVLIHALALTSTTSDVRYNADLALRVLAEWKFGSDESLRSRFGLNGANFTDIMNGGYLRADFKNQQQQSLAKAFTQFATLREGEQPLTSSIHGGPKTHSYAGSFLAALWRNHLGPVVGDARRAFDEALSVFAWDRHHNRLDNGATGVNHIEAFLNRERGVLTARHMGLSPEEAQSAGWLWVRNAQGLISPIKGDGDTATALREAIEKTWNHDADAGNSWADVVRKMQAEKNLGPEEAVDQTYDAVRQEIFYKLLKKSLRDPKVIKELERHGLSPDLTSLKDDVLGLMQRGSQGLAPDEWPNPLKAIHAPGGLADSLASAAPGQVLQYQNGSWITSARGHGVPIALGRSYRAGQVQSSRKSLEGLLNRGVVSDLFDPAAGVDNTSRVGIGLVQDGHELRPAVFALTDDPAAAARGASRTELGRVYDLANGSGIEVPGTTWNRHLPGLLDDITGPGTPNPRLALEDVRKRGVTRMEMDTTNFWSILQRKVANPFMDAYAQVSLKEGTKQITGQDLGDIHAPDFPERVVGAAPKLTDLISDPDHAVLAQTLKDGRTYKDVYVRDRITARTDMERLKQSGLTWKAYSTLEERLQLVKDSALTEVGKKQLRKIITDWHDKGIDLLYAGTPEAAATKSLIATKNAEKGIKVARPTNYSLFRAAWGELAMFSPKNLASNLQGNWFMNALDGTRMSLNPQQYLAAYKMAAGGAETITRQEAMASLGSAVEGQMWGITPPEELLRGGIRGMTSSSTRVTPSAVGELVSRVTRNPALGRRVGTPFVVRNDLAQAIDTVGRDAAYRSGLKQAMWDQVPSFESEVHRVAQGIPGFEFSIRDRINLPAGGLSPGGLKDTFIELGISEGQANHLANVYANMARKGKTAGIDRMNRVMFSYDYTNLDRWISKVVPFHYWWSRAMRYYGEAAIRHPFLALNYMRAMDGIDDVQNDPGMSARQKGFLRILGTPLGFSLLMNPDALFGVVQVFNMDDSIEPDGETSLGGAIRYMKQGGFGLLPWFDGMFNLMGIYGNTFEPDLLGIRHKALVGASINFARAHLGFDPAGAPYADAMGNLRYSVSSFVDSFTPDWLAKTVPPRAGGSSQEASLDTIIESIVLDNNPGLTNGQLMEIMSDPDNPEYERAYQQTADAGIVQQLLNFILPASFRMRGDQKDVLAAQNNTIYEAAQAAGVAPWDFAPTKDDLAFKAKYKNLTGKDWQPGDYEDANTKYDLIRAPLEAKPFIVSAAAYQQLGTPKQQRRFDTYWALRNGSDPRTAGLNEDGRKEIALEWADAHHATDAVNEVYSLRDAFETSHPEFAEFKQWQGRVSNLASLYGGNLEEYRRRSSQQNPNAAKFFADKLEFVKATYPQEQWPVEMDKATISAAAFNAITGKGVNRQSVGPIPGAPRADITLPGMEPPAPVYASGPKQPNWIQELHNLPVRGPMQ